MQKPIYLTDNYWNSLDDRSRDLYVAIRPMPKSLYEVDIQLNRIEGFLENQEQDMASMGGCVELEPDFQRGHVWTQDQRTKYMESVFRGTAPVRILFNCPNWEDRGESGDIPHHTFQCIDGLQRLTAIRAFLRGEFKVFGAYAATDLEKTAFDCYRYFMKMCVFGFANRADLLSFYCDLNGGGTVHPESELARVRALRDAALKGAK